MIMSCLLYSLYVFTGPGLHCTTVHSSELHMAMSLLLYCLYVLSAERQDIKPWRGAIKS